MRAKLFGRGSNRRWKLFLGTALPAGRYLVAFRAVDREGNVEREVAGQGKIVRFSVGRR
jgi:hypothetical protein